MNVWPDDPTLEAEATHRRWRVVRERKGFTNREAFWYGASWGALAMFWLLALVYVWVK